VHAWAREALRGGQRAPVDDALQHASDALVDRSAWEPPHALVHSPGLPDGAVAQKLATGLRDGLWQAAA